jgi:hypothetical protein
MKNVNSILLRATCLAALAVSSYADTVLVTGAGSATSLAAGVATNNAPGPFFDNLSEDGRTCNIGYVLTGQSPFTVGGTPCAQVNGDITGLPVGDDVWSYWSNGGSVLDGFAIQADAFGNGSAATLLIEIAGGVNANGFGIRSNGVDTELFPQVSGHPVSAFITVGPNQVFDFYHQTDGGRFYSNTAGDASRFALFTRNSATSGNGTMEYLIGIEDGSDADYQDMIIRITVVPEPATVTALGAAVLATIVTVRRRRKA